VGDNAYLMGTFVATNSDMSFSQVLPSGHGYFGAIVVRQAPPAVSVARAGSSMNVSWDAGSLWQAPSVNGPWSQVIGATSPYPVSTTAPQMFFRASNP